MNTNTLPSQTEMKRAVYNRDVSYDGIFFVAVKSTNIFCRPGCTARKPLELSGTHPEWIKKIMAEAEKSDDKRINDSQIRKMGIEPARARRYFLKNYGMTFHAYQRSRRLSKAFEQIRNGRKMDDVIFGNGYESHSGFRDAFHKVFGKSPGKSQTGECIVTSLMESPLGPIIIGATSEAICLVEFSDRRMLEFQLKTSNRRFNAAIIPGTNDIIKQTEAELKEYFAGNLKKFRVPLTFPGTYFQQKVWSELLKIPYGKTISYEELAGKVGVDKAQRAVGTANGMNRIGIIIPCHRVVNKNGKLGSYGGGLWRKQWLLDLEKNVLS